MTNQQQRTVTLIALIAISLWHSMFLVPVIRDGAYFRAGVCANQVRASCRAHLPAVVESLHSSDGTSAVALLAGDERFATDIDTCANCGIERGAVVTAEVWGRKVTAILPIGRSSWLSTHDQPPAPPPAGFMVAWLVVVTGLWLVTVAQGICLVASRGR
jgi:hypothetical protein